MTSKETDEKNETSPLTLQGLSIDDKFERISCPFTWGLIGGTASTRSYEIILKKREERFTMALDRQAHFPELEIIYYLMTVFEDATYDDVPSAVKFISKAEESLPDIKQKLALENVGRVLEHIVVGTKCHVLKLQERLTEVNELLKEICDISEMNEKERAMLNGCKSSACSLYAVESNLGITFARIAIELEPSNGKWYYLLGQNCRALRRLYRAIAKPENEEIVALKKAYALSKNVLFGVSLDQLYRESGAYGEANRIYKEVYDLQPTCCTVRLLLALGFIRTEEKKLAKECLDYVAEKVPDSCRFMHYMAINEEKCNKDFEAALPYYKGTTDKLNWTAEMQYLNCKMKVEPDWDPLPHMLNLLNKYEGYVCFINKEINIQIGSHYVFKLRDITSGCKHLLEAIQIDPSTNKLKDDYVPSREAQTVLKKVAAMNDDESIPILKETLELCRKCCTNFTTKYVSSLAQTRNLQSRNNWRRNDQRFAPRSGSGKGAERSSSSSEGDPKSLS